MATETLDYTILKKDGRFEIRRYASYIVAEVAVPGNYNSALLKGFRILADYIFGNNRSQQHIAMTSPVMQSPTPSERIEMTTPVLARKAAANQHIISFVVPRKYSMDTLPEPVSGDIHFRTVQAHRAAVIRFSGYLNSRTKTARSKELQNWLESRGIRPEGDFVSCQYNPPWILGIFRRNEVMVAVADDT